MIRVKAPLVWSLFAAGGMVAALLLPALIFSGFLVAPLGWAGPSDGPEWLSWYASPVVRIVLSFVLPVSFYHAAHRMRYTLYDGLQLYHLDPLITTHTYGVATLLSGVTLVVLWVLL